MRSSLSVYPVSKKTLLELYCYGLMKIVWLRYFKPHRTYYTTFNKCPNLWRQKSEKNHLYGYFTGIQFLCNYAFMFFKCLVSVYDTQTIISVIAPSSHIKSISYSIIRREYRPKHVLLARTQTFCTNRCSITWLWQKRNRSCILN